MICSHFPHYVELYEHKYAKIGFQHRCHQSGCRHRAVNINSPSQIRNAASGCSVEIKNLLVHLCCVYVCRRACVCHRRWISSTCPSWFTLGNTKRRLCRTGRAKTLSPWGGNVELHADSFISPSMHNLKNKCEVLGLETRMKLRSPGTESRSLL